MYATSFVLTLDRIEETLDRALEIETFRRSGPALRIASDAADAVEDIGELSSVALPRVSTESMEQTAGDDAVRTILADRIDSGIGFEIDEDVLDRAREADRITDIDGQVIVPVGAGMPALRNWWLLADLLRSRLERVRDGFRRVHRRARIDGPDLVETMFWTVSEQLAALEDALSSALLVGRYTRRVSRQGAATLLSGVETLATAVAGGDSA